MDARDFKLQFTAVSSYGSKESPVLIILGDGTSAEIQDVTWDSEIETVCINAVTPDPPVDPPVDPPEDNPEA